MRFKLQGSEMDNVVEVLSKIRPHKTQQVELQSKVLDECHLNNCFWNCERTLHLHPGGTIQGGWMVHKHLFMKGIYELHAHYWIKHKGKHIDHSPMTPSMIGGQIGIIADDGVSKYIEKNERRVPPTFMIGFPSKDNPHISLWMEDANEKFEKGERYRTAVIEAWEQHGKDVRDDFKIEDCEAIPFDIVKYLVDGLLTNKVLSQLGEKHQDFITWEMLQYHNTKIQKFNKVLEQIKKVA